MHDQDVQLFTARAWKEDGIWNAKVLELPIAVFGSTFEQVRTRIENALEQHLNTIIELGVYDEHTKHLRTLAAPVAARRRERFFELYRQI